MYKCCFLACFCASQRVQRRKAELTLAQIQEKLPNGWADWHQFWHTCANSYGNGYMPNKLPLETRGGGGTLGVLGGKQFKSPGKLSDWHQLWFTSADSSWNAHRLNTSRPLIPQVAFREWGRVSQIQKSGEAVKRLDRLTPNFAHICRSIWEWIYAKQIAPRDSRGTWGI